MLRRLRDHAPEPAKPFAWLGRSQTNVFVPVLLGAGVVLSGLAWLVDRVARLTAVPSMERGLARRLNTLQPPPGGLLGEAPDRPVPAAMKRLAIAVAVVAALALLVGELGDLTQSRPDPVRARRGDGDRARRRSGPLRARPGRRRRPPCGACAPGRRARRSSDDGDLAPIAGGRYRVVLEPAVGDHERRKLVGCLEDLTVDRVLGDVESFRIVAAG